MKKLNLENYGVQEMNEMEMMNVDGGAPVPYWKYYWSGTDNELNDYLMLYLNSFL